MELTFAAAEETYEFGVALAGLLRAGDLVLLHGDLGAGKTTLTRGIGEGLGVAGTVASPTFIIARTHAPLADGPWLVHVDAYRIGGLDDLETLDLDTSLEESVTVVEWGEGLAEALADSRLEIRITRPHGGIGKSMEDDGARTVAITGTGERWASLDGSLSRIAAARAGGAAP